MAKEPEPRGRLPRRPLRSTCRLHGSPPAGLERGPRTSTGSDESRPEVTSPSAHLLASSFLFFSQHAPRGPAPPVAQCGRLSGAGLSPAPASARRPPVPSTVHTVPSVKTPPLVLRGDRQHLDREGQAGTAWTACPKVCGAVPKSPSRQWSPPEGGSSPRGKQRQHVTARARPWWARGTRTHAFLCGAQKGRPRSLFPPPRPPSSHRVPRRGNCRRDAWCAGVLPLRRRAATRRIALVP